MNETSKIAIFFDAENVPAAMVPEIISFLSTKGDILFQRAYADWSIANTKAWQTQITKTPITAIQQFHHNQEQAVDKAVMMDAIELAIKHEEIDIFTLVASDNGYYSLSLRLRELGKRVIGIGEKGKCSPIWINSCNEFQYFEDLEEVDDDILLQSEKPAETSEIKDFALEKFLERAFDSTPFYKDTNTKLLSQMWESILRQKPDFSVKDYGKKTAREFIMSFDDKFKVSDDGKNQKTFFVEKIESKNSQRITGIIKRKIGCYCIISSTDKDKKGDYFFYRNEINPKYKKQKLEKGMKVNFVVVREPNLNSGTFKDKNGRATDLMIEQQT
ncbi:NYN domain-containing protein [Treponema berlinense]|uniref:NYN domain-containing protein n=1 Tax=Treponema berlinense TaxID=225004 RepID=UPI0026F0120A|nr:NYN domain-containing protein [Treponema berlinense]